MSNVIEEKPVDVAVVGLGVAGGVVATELAVNGVTVAGIDKGFYWDYLTDWTLDRKANEWSTAMEHPSDHQLSLWSLTLRHNSRQVALPLRRYIPGVNWVMGNGVGGAAVHYSAGFGRFGPWAFEVASSTASKYGTSFLSSIEPNLDLEDWPISYSDATPYYDTFEQSWGVSGTNQDPFTPNADYPVPPHPNTPLGQTFNSAALDLGYHPHQAVSAILSKPYTNQYGVSRSSCVYDGFCGGGEGCFYYCETGAKTSTHVSHIPAAIKSGNLTMALNSVVSRIEVDPSSGKASGVTYTDSRGNIHYQPASVVYAGAYLVNNMRLFFLSGVGQPYNPFNQTGSLGRAFVQGAGASGTTSVSGVLNMGGNGYSAGNASGGGYTIEDFADDNFDHTGLNFIGGANISIGGYLGGSPHTFTSITPGANNMGSTFKASLKDSKLLTKLGVAVSPSGPLLPTTGDYTSLDPHYTDVYGDPLLRVTTDFDVNSWNAADYLAPKAAEILTQMGCTNVTTNKGQPLSTHPNGSNIHYRGGMRMGADSATSTTNRWLQSWDVQNLFSCSESSDTFGDNTTAGTHIIGMMAYIAADGIRKYLQSPGDLEA
jgi:gluconate 2-dehydrogenase alpha chain